MKNTIIKNMFLFCLVVSVASCTTQNKPSKITSETDYNVYLEANSDEAIQNATEDFEFWNAKHESTPNQFPYLVKMAASQELLFGLTGDIKHLTLAAKYLEQANIDTKFRNAGYLRSLAKNYISQHRFKESLALLEKAELIGDNLLGTQKMLFDVHLELGNTDAAKQYLSTLTNEKDFDYLIRLAKWKDHEGDLDAAILNMEKAMERAEYYDNEHLKQWSYTNLADFYGHAGRVSDSYEYYLKALALDANDAYAKKGIAWIAYSYEKNTEKATAILNTIAAQNQAPDYYLFQAELAEYNNDLDLKGKYLAKYLALINNAAYGDMYNKYKTLLFAEELNQPDVALQIARKEIEQRPTPQSYDLLAWSLYQNGEFNAALDIVEKHVNQKTFEPEAQYHMAEIYKANNIKDKTQKLKTELLDAAYELGPVMTEKINQL